MVLIFIARSVGIPVSLISKKSVSTHNVKYFEQKTTTNSGGLPEKKTKRIKLKLNLFSAAEKGNMKAQIALGLIFIGLMFSLIGSLWFLIEGFKESVLWGIALILLSPIAGTVFLIYYWERVCVPFLANTIGCALIFTGFMIGVLINQ
jgi:hypothetical protein